MDRFLSIKNPKNKIQIEDLIELATEIHSRGMVITAALFMQFIGKIPEIVRATICPESKSGKRWAELSQITRKAIWVKFAANENQDPLSVLQITQNQENNGYRENKFQRNQLAGPIKFCTLHGECGNLTKECEQLRR